MELLERQRRQFRPGRPSWPRPGPPQLGRPNIPPLPPEQVRLLLYLLLGFVSFVILAYVVVFLFQQIWTSSIPRRKPVGQNEQYLCTPQCQGRRHTNSLCSACQHVINKSWIISGSRLPMTKRVEFHNHHPTWEKLETSAESCHMCFLLTCSRSQYLWENGQQWKTDITMPHFRESTRLPKRFDYILVPSLLFRTSKTLQIRVWVDTIWPDYEPQSFIQMCSEGTLPLTVLEVYHTHTRTDCEVDTGSVQSLSRIRDLIEECSEFHSVCKDHNSEQASFRPTRLLQINSGNVQNIRLVETSRLKREVSYVALSHCWGGIVSTQLTSSNHAAFQRGIDTSQFPKNFQDAIKATHQLGVRHLWIDSLCIIQDSREDWKVESSNMGLVYANALCTISATASSNSNGGCFRPMEPFAQDCQLRSSAGSATILQSRLRYPSEPWLLLNARVEEAPISKRGWTLQERLLSRRMVHFCSDAFIFECLSSRILSPGSIPQYTHKGRSTRKKSTNAGFAPQVDQGIYLPMGVMDGIRNAFEKMMSTDSSSTLTIAEQLEIHQRWYEIVSNYSSRELTKAEDKLMAIAGIAGFITRKSGMNFVAGLWENTLLFNLLWVLKSSPQKRDARRTASWSWASVNGGVGHLLLKPERGKYREQHENSIVKSKYPDLPKFNVSVASIEPVLRVQGVIHDAHLVISGALFRFEPSSPRSLLAGIEMVFDVELNVERAQLHFLPVFSFAAVKDIYSDSVAIKHHGILLEKTGSNTFERIGHFIASGSRILNMGRINRQERHRFVIK